MFDQRGSALAAPDRSVDIDDVLVNGTGALLGYGLFKTIAIFRGAARRA